VADDHDVLKETFVFRFFRFRLFRRPQIATFAEHERLVDEVVELFRMPVEQELCAPEATASVNAEAVPVLTEHGPARSDSVAA
jgi:hypothetical protein